MKTKKMIWIALLFITLVVALVVATFDQPGVSAQNLDSASISLRITPTPVAEGVSVIGSTDGIFIMGAIIVMIVILPILFYRNKN